MQKICNIMIYMIFQYGWEPYIHRIQSHTGDINIFFCIIAFLIWKLQIGNFSTFLVICRKTVKIISRSSAFHGKMFLLPTIIKNYDFERLLAAKRPNIHVMAATHFSQNPKMHRESFTVEKTRKISIFRAFMCAAR